MRQWVVLSGKGGTGKTTVTAALAHLAARRERLVLADADVDAANLELLLDPEPLEAHDFVAGQVARIDRQRCSGCGICLDTCRFAAIDDGYRVDPLACEGCAACYHVCPAGAIALEDQVAGRWFHSRTALGPLYHARLFAGRENSGKLVTQVKQSAFLAAARSRADLLLVDGPPGIGCPVIAATTGANLALLVVEPTVSGAHDLERILGTTRHFGVRAAVCINKHDINSARAGEIEAWCAAAAVPVVGRIPFDEAVIEATVQRRPVTAGGASAVTRAIEDVWSRLSRLAEAATTRE